MLHNLYLLIFLYRVLSEIPSSSAAFLRFPLFFQCLFYHLLVRSLRFRFSFSSLISSISASLGFGFIGSPHASCSYFLTDVLELVEIGNRRYGDTGETDGTDDERDEPEKLMKPEIRMILELPGYSAELEKHIRLYRPTGVLIELLAQAVHLSSQVAHVAPQFVENFV